MSKGAVRRRTQLCDLRGQEVEKRKKKRARGQAWVTSKRHAGQRAVSKRPHSVYTWLG